MNVTERAAVIQGLELYDELGGAVNGRTFEVLAHRRRAAKSHRRGWLVRRVLLAADVIALVASFLVAEILFFEPRAGADAVSMRMELLLFVLVLPAWIVAAKLYGLYDRDEQGTDHSTADDVLGVFHLVTLGSWVFLGGAWLTDLAHPTLPKILAFWAFAVVAMTTGRAVARAVARRSISYVQNTVVVGAGAVGQKVARKILNHPEYGLNLVGFVDASPREPAPGLEHLAMLGPPDRLPGVIQLFDVERVVVAFTSQAHEETLELLRLLKDLDVQIDVVPRFFDVVCAGMQIHSIEGLPIVGLPRLRLARSSRLLKRTMDFGLAAVGLLLLAPLFLVIAIAIKVDSPGPVFFRQVRMGSGGQVFRIWKFRSMRADAEEQKDLVAHLNKHALAGGDPRMFKIEDDPRITRVGRFLRHFSLDELPQLINVVKGEMSLVGPRPLILDEDQHVADWARRRLDLKPGMTGVWQVLGRDDIPFEEMVKLDYLYVTGWSLYADLKLILRTLPAVFGPREAY